MLTLRLTGYLSSDCKQGTDQRVKSFNVLIMYSNKSVCCSCKENALIILNFSTPGC